MTFFQAILLGILQGITEFLPISSSGHLVLLPYFLNWNLNQDFMFIFDILVQFGTLISILIFYRKDILDIAQNMLRSIQEKNLFNTAQSRIGWFTCFATIPAGIAGLLIKDQIEGTFNNPSFVAVFLLITAALLILGEYTGRREKTLEDMNIFDALWIGTIQILALFPGISRSGSTISAGMTRNLKRNDAGLFSFFMAIPILTVASIIGFFDLMQLQEVNSYLLPLIIGGITAGSVGFFTIKWLLGFLKSHSLLPFIIYCSVLGISILLYQNIGSQLKPNFQFQNQGSEIKVLVDQELEWMLPEINQCGESNYHITVKSIVNKPGTNPANELIISLGELPEHTAGEVFQVGNEPLELIGNMDSPIQTISQNILREIFNGKIKNCQQISDQCDFCLEKDDIPDEGPLRILAHPEESRISAEIQEKLLGNDKLDSFATIAPSSKHLLLEVQKSRNALALMPEGWVDGTVKLININNKIGDDLSLPILVYWPAETSKEMKTFIGCIQESINSRIS